MERLTTDTPSNNEETLDNYAYVENSLVKLRYADGEEGIDLADYIARCARKKEPCRDVMASDVLHGNTCGIGTECDCELAVLNIVAIQAAELREQLKAYEDTGLAPEEINRAVSIQHWEDAYKELYERDLAELKKYRDAEEQGRLVSRPVDLEFGKSVFLTREAAEAKLKEMESALIDPHKAVAIIKSYAIGEQGDYSDGIADAVHCVLFTPKVDAVPVVRCCEC